MANVTFRGKAAVEGVAGAYDAILYAINQTVKVTQQFDVEEIKDEHGFDLAWLFRNEHAMFDASLKLLGDTAAHAKIPATAVAGSSPATSAAVSSLGAGPFLSPGSTVTLSGFDIVAINGKYQVLPGSDVDLGNTKAGDLTLKLRKYADSTQNALTSTIPT